MRCHWIRDAVGDLPSSAIGVAGSSCANEPGLPVPLVSAAQALGTFPTLPCLSTEKLTRGSRSGRSR